MPNDSLTLHGNFCVADLLLQGMRIEDTGRSRGRASGGGRHTAPKQGFSFVILIHTRILHTAISLSGVFALLLPGASKAIVQA